MRKQLGRWFVACAAVLVVTALLGACESNPSEPSNQEQARKAIDQKIANREYYTPKNDVEFNNYQARQKLADDPTAILWCTTAFNQPGTPMFTVPIVGKLTSGNKRPYPTEIVREYTDHGSYYPELHGPDGMYGTSGEYRYGFSPGGVYEDFYNMPTYCTNEPTVFQRDSTEIVLQTAGDLQSAAQQAEAALASGDKAQAEQILNDAINGGK